MSENERALLFVAVSSQVQAEVDKVSLDEQERACREWCAAHNVAVIGVLNVPGFSRSESDVVTALSDFEAQGVTAYSELRRAWKARSFDVLVTYHPSRLGRSQSLYTYVVENTINCGAYVQCVIGGRIDEANAEFGIAMGGVQARGEQRRFAQMGHAAKMKLVERGLPWARVVQSHRVERDRLGKPVRVVVDESKHQLVRDAALLVIEGLSWRLLPGELLSRYGHRNGNGYPFHFSAFYRLFYAATFWGHGVIYPQIRNEGEKRAALWLISEEYPPPPKAKIFYNTHPPALEGDIAIALKSELVRRVFSANGRGGKAITRAFSRLLVCTHCGSVLSYNGTGLRCLSRYYPGSPIKSTCPAVGLVNIALTRGWIQSFISQYATLEDFRAALSGNIEFPPLRSLETHLESLTRKIHLLTTRLSEIDDIAVPEVSARLSALIQERKVILSRLELARAEDISSRASIVAASRSLDEIRSLGWDRFWEQDGLKINPEGIQ